jgi:hypothetical protein
MILIKLLDMKVDDPDQVVKREGSHGSIEDNNVIPTSRREAGSNAGSFGGGSEGFVTRVP